MTFVKDIKQYPELTDLNPVAVELTNQEWSVIFDWMSHVPFEKSRQILEAFRDQASKVKEEDYEKPFTAVLTVEQYNAVLGSLCLAPYYTVAEIITKIHAQAKQEIEEWRKLYITEPLKQNEQSATE